MKDGHLERHIRHIRHIRRMRRTSGLRRDALVQSLHRFFGDRATVLGEAAGMHAYVRLDDPEVAMRALQNKVQLRAVGAYYRGKAPPHENLLGFSLPAEHSIREGIERLANRHG